MEKIIKLFTKIKHKLNSILYRLILKNLGSKSVVCYPFSVDNAKNMEIGVNVYIKPNAWFISILSAANSVSLKIGNNTYIGRNAHFVSMKNIQIGNDVLIADNVYLSDNIHQYNDIKMPIKNQPLLFKGSVFIGDQSWLGENVSVIGCSVGKHSVVGANSVVTNDIPDYCIAVGSPAKVIKKYDFKSKEWLKV
jgi:acetyltransferase-like isoleucine patch superfamily enzyme